jgi:hypothetical protein
VSYVAAGFVVGYGAPYTANYFTVDHVAGDLTAPADNPGTGQRNGLYNTTGTRTFPSLNTAELCFYADLIFEAE